MASLIWSEQDQRQRRRMEQERDLKNYQRIQQEERKERQLREKLLNQTEARRLLSNPDSSNYQTSNPSVNSSNTSKQAQEQSNLINEFTPKSEPTTFLNFSQDFPVKQRMIPNPSQGSFSLGNSSASALVSRQENLNQIHDIKKHPGSSESGSQGFPVNSAPPPPLQLQPETLASLLASTLASNPMRMHMGAEDSTPSYSAASTLNDLSTRLMLTQERLEQEKRSRQWLESEVQSGKTIIALLAAKIDKIQESTRSEHVMIDSTSKSLKDMEARAEQQLQSMSENFDREMRRMQQHVSELSAKQRYEEGGRMDLESRNRNLGEELNALKFRMETWVQEASLTDSQLVLKSRDMEHELQKGAEAQKLIRMHDQALSHLNSTIESKNDNLGKRIDFSFSDVQRRLDAEKAERYSFEQATKLMIAELHKNLSHQFADVQDKFGQAKAMLQQQAYHDQQDRELLNHRLLEGMKQLQESCADALYRQDERIVKSTAQLEKQILEHRDRFAQMSDNLGRDANDGFKLVQLSMNKRTDEIYASQNEIKQGLTIAVKMLQESILLVEKNCKQNYAGLEEVLRAEIQSRLELNEATKAALDELKDHQSRLEMDVSQKLHEIDSESRNATEDLAKALSAKFNRQEGLLNRQADDIATQLQLIHDQQKETPSIKDLEHMQALMEARNTKNSEKIDDVEARMVAQIENILNFDVGFLQQFNDAQAGYKRMKEDIESRMASRHILFEQTMEALKKEFAEYPKRAELQKLCAALNAQRDCMKAIAEEVTSEMRQIRDQADAVKQLNEVQHQTILASVEERISDFASSRHIQQSLDQLKANILSQMKTRLKEMSRQLMDQISNNSATGDEAKEAFVESLQSSSLDHENLIAAKVVEAELRLYKPIQKLELQLSQLRENVSKIKAGDQKATVSEVYDASEFQSMIQRLEDQLESKTERLSRMDERILKAFGEMDVHFKHSTKELESLLLRHLEQERSEMQKILSSSEEKMDKLQIYLQDHPQKMIDDRYLSKSSSEEVLQLRGELQNQIAELEKVMKYVYPSALKGVQGDISYLRKENGRHASQLEMLESELKVLGSKSDLRQEARANHHNASILSKRNHYGSHLSERERSQMDSLSFSDNKKRVTIAVPDDHQSMRPTSEGSQSSLVPGNFFKPGHIAFKRTSSSQSSLSATYSDQPVRPKTGFARSTTAADTESIADSLDTERQKDDYDHNYHTIRPKTGFYRPESVGAESIMDSTNSAQFSSDHEHDNYDERLIQSTAGFQRPGMVDYEQASYSNGEQAIRPKTGFKRNSVKKARDDHKKSAKVLHESQSSRNDGESYGAYENFETADKNELSRGGLHIGFSRPESAETPQSSGVFSESKSKLVTTVASLNYRSASPEQNRMTSTQSLDISSNVTNGVDRAASKENLKQSALRQQNSGTVFAANVISNIGSPSDENSKNTSTTLSASSNNRPSSKVDVLDDGFFDDFEPTHVTQEEPMEESRKDSLQLLGNSDKSIKISNNSVQSGANVEQLATLKSSMHRLDVFDAPHTSQNISTPPSINDFADGFFDDFEPKQSLRAESKPTAIFPNTPSKEDEFADGFFDDFEPKQSLLAEYEPETVSSNPNLKVNDLADVFFNDFVPSQPESNLETSQKLSIANGALLANQISAKSQIDFHKPSHADQLSERDYEESSVETQSTNAQSIEAVSIVDPIGSRAHDSPLADFDSDNNFVDDDMSEASQKSNHYEGEAQGIAAASIDGVSARPVKKSSKKTSEPVITNSTTFKQSLESGLDEKGMSKSENKQSEIVRSTPAFREAMKSRSSIVSSKSRKIESSSSSVGNVTKDLVENEETSPELDDFSGDSDTAVSKPAALEYANDEIPKESSSLEENSSSERNLRLDLYSNPSVPTAISKSSRSYTPVIKASETPSEIDYSEGFHASDGKYSEQEAYLNLSAKIDESLNDGFADFGSDGLAESSANLKSGSILSLTNTFNENNLDNDDPVYHSGNADNCDYSASECSVPVHGPQTDGSSNLDFLRNDGNALHTPGKIVKKAGSSSRETSSAISVGTTNIPPSSELNQQVLATSISMSTATSDISKGKSISETQSLLVRSTQSSKSDGLVPKVKGQTFESALQQSEQSVQAHSFDRANLASRSLNETHELKKTVSQIKESRRGSAANRLQSKSGSEVPSKQSLAARSLKASDTEIGNFSESYSHDDSIPKPGSSRESNQRSFSASILSKNNSTIRSRQTLDLKSNEDEITSNERPQSNQAQDIKTVNSNDLFSHVNSVESVSDTSLNRKTQKNDPVADTPKSISCQSSTSISQRPHENLSFKNSMGELSTSLQIVKATAIKESIRSMNEKDLDSNMGSRHMDDNISSRSFREIESTSHHSRKSSAVKTEGVRTKRSTSRSETPNASASLKPNHSISRQTSSISEKSLIREKKDLTKSRDGSVRNVGDAQNSNSASHQLLLSRRSTISAASLDSNSRDLKPLISSSKSNVTQDVRRTPRSASSKADPKDAITKRIHSGQSRHSVISSAKAQSKETECDYGEDFEDFSESINEKEHELPIKSEIQKVPSNYHSRGGSIKASTDSLELTRPRSRSDANLRDLILSPEQPNTGGIKASTDSLELSRRSKTKSDANLRDRSATSEEVDPLLGMETPPEY